MAHKLTMYENLQDMVERELGEIERKGDINKENLDNLYKLAMVEKSIAKKIDMEKMEESEKKMSMGMNRSYDSYGNSMSPMQGSYENWRSPRSFYEIKSYGEQSYNDQMSRDYSQARTGRDGDGDGRYNEGRSRDYSGRDYSYNDQVSRDASKKRMAQKLSTLMDDTMSEKERMAIQECIEKIQK